MPKTSKAKKKVSKTKTKVVSKSKQTTAKVVSKGPIKISKTYIPKDTEKYMCEKHKIYFLAKRKDIELCLGDFFLITNHLHELFLLFHAFLLRQ